MLQPKPLHSDRDDSRHMALALEGVAGALHAGRPVDAEDLRHAARAAEQVWASGPKPDAAQDREFQDSCSAFSQAAAGCAHGQPKEAAIVERNALAMARQLRWMSQHPGSNEARQGLSPQASSDLVALATKYGRYGIRPMAA